jgi:hypothetical protein
MGKKTMTPSAVPGQSIDSILSVRPPLHSAIKTGKAAKHIIGSEQEEILSDANALDTPATDNPPTVLAQAPEIGRAHV